VDFECGRHAHAGHDWRFAADHLLEAAKKAWRRGRTQELDESARLAVEACANDERVADLAGWSTLWYARAFQMRGEAHGATEQYREAHRLLEEKGDERGVLEALIGMGWAAVQAGDLAGAAKLYSQAMNQARRLKHLRLEANAIEGMAWVEQQKRNFEGADILFTRVLNRFNQLEDKRGTANAALGQAFVARQTGEFDDANELYEESVSTYQEAEDLIGVARALCGQAGVFRQLEQNEQAEEFFRQSMGIAEDLGVTDLLMESRLGLAEIYRRRGEFDRARHIYENHARWATRQNVFEAGVYAHLGLGMVALQQNDMMEVYNQANEAVKYLNKVPGHWLWASYRLLVATMLAYRLDEEQTYRWLWSASELGLGDWVDHDTAENLTAIFHKASENGWVNAVRLAGKLGVSQWERLGQRERSREMKKRIAEMFA
ncbi:MAG: tetratricopeptide repeat protein, partial [Proteobacteria bacterium]|nr:tetratricopeptide repeat protein [Pseudomonadota bacterium]